MLNLMPMKVALMAGWSGIRTMFAEGGKLHLNHSTLVFHRTCFSCAGVMHSLSDFHFGVLVTFTKHEVLMTSQQNNQKLKIKLAWRISVLENALRFTCSVVGIAG